MKPLSAFVLFFAFVFGRQYSLCSCDEKQDVPNPSPQADKQHPVGGAQDLSSQEDEKEKNAVDLAVSPEKPDVMTSVEYVNNEAEEKDVKQFVDQMENAESLHSGTLESKSIDVNLKSSISSKDDNVEVIAKSSESLNSIPKKSPEMPILSEDASNLVGTHGDIPPVGPLQPIPKEAEAPAPLHVASISLASESVKLVDESPQPHYDGMPSFDEWKKMMLAEQEKGGQKILPSPPGKKISSQKRRRNYASYECGAKIVSANGEAEGTNRILNEKTDEYMLNPCKAKIWFVIELCEAVQALQIELANFELFSSCPRDFVVYSSNSFPTREWISLGTFTAAELRVLQSFELKQEGFGKFIKIELLSHYGEEHYCPLSVVRIFGTSMVDEYEEMETLASHPVIDDDLDRLDVQAEDKKSTNLFGSATDAVMNIVKKAAQALGQKSEEMKSNETSVVDSQNISEAKSCNSVDTHHDSSKEVSAASGQNISQAALLSPSSMQLSLLQLLRKCDQCVSLDVSHCSSGKTHCRFFQAALGLVVFQTLCDWIREHPLPAASKTPMFDKNAASAEELVLTPTRSPPPQIVRVPMEKHAPAEQFLNKSLSPSEGDVSANDTKPSRATNASAHDFAKIELQPSIKPTKVSQSGHSTAYNGSQAETQHTSKDPSPDLVQSVHLKATDLPEKTDVGIQETPAAQKVEIDAPSSSVLTESEEQQMHDFLSESSIVSPEDLTIEIATPATELPAGFMATEDTRVDGRFEAVPAASQKESVFMRMSNRIKALEVNMSLSSQYLQELSQRYRRQMDDMQRAFNRTIGTLNDTARKAAEKDLKQQEALNHLQMQVESLAKTVELFSEERSLLMKQVVETHICFMLMEVIVIVAIMSLYIRRISSMHSPQPATERTASVHSSVLAKRRNSVDSLTPPIARKVKKRSCSEEVLNPEYLIVEPLPDPNLKPKKKNKKRHKGIHRSLSHPAVQECVKAGLCPGGLHTHSDGCVAGRPSPCTDANSPGHACENCDISACPRTQISSKELRRNCIPLQNLTNGSAVAMSRNKALRGRERFSIRKFLKFQKRDSI